jgi:hypothetical protein
MITRSRRQILRTATIAIFFSGTLMAGDVVLAGNWTTTSPTGNQKFSKNIVQINASGTAPGGPISYTITM